MPDSLVPPSTEVARLIARLVIPVDLFLIFIAAVLRILPKLSSFCRTKLLILLLCTTVGRTLDLRIGVRVPASQPHIPCPDRTHG